ncbi:MFS transporter [Alloscardovia macacae]|uniref:MFS transporter n=1 Tax=Alloscardovia macacae TaxID=1160091 RepID=A0A1Y2SUX0_9BIFI|nr:MFS transporter [Alloscardovia macacae]OTA25848.1 MFS transporter [Alloscardovia macacae]OTA28671.1 MFS transporter [Alloscardovia macacae]
MSQLTSSNKYGKSIFQRVFGGYSELLRIPGTARYAVGAVVASMPFPMVGMCITISVQQIYGSYTLAGTLSAVQAISLACLTPLFGKLVDRFGQTRVSLPIIAVWVAAAIALMTCIQLRVPQWILYFIVPFMAFVPPWGAMSRSRWTYLLKNAEDGAEKINRAMGFSSILDEAMWMIGNPLSSILAVVSGVLSFSFTGVCVAVGALMFLSVRSAEPPSQTDLAREAGLTRKEYRAREAARAAGAAEVAGAGAGAAGSVGAAGAEVERAGAKRQSIFSLGFISICATWFGLGAFQSASGISIIAFAREQNVQSFTGFVFACFSFSALVGATLYGAKDWSIPLWKRFYFCIIVVAVGLSSFLLAQNIWTIMIIYLVIGVCQSPTWINGNQIILHLVPPARFTEGVGIMSAMNAIGGSVGNSIAGVFIDKYGAHGGFATVCVLAVVAVVIAFSGVKQIREATLKPMLVTVEA